MSLGEVLKNLLCHLSESYRGAVFCGAVYDAICEIPITI